MLNFHKSILPLLTYNVNNSKESPNAHLKIASNYYTTHKSVSRMKNKTSLKEAVITGDWSKVDISQITLKEFMKLDEDGKSHIYHARTHGTLHKFPKEVIGETGIIWNHPVMKKYTLLGLASEGKISLAPEKLITKETLVEKNDQGTTLLHYIACFDSIKNIDQGLLSSGCLMVQNSYDSTPLEVASQQLRKFLESPISPKPKGTTESIKRVKENIALILKNLSLKDLESKKWDEEALPYIKPEVIKRKIIQEIKSGGMGLEI
jgi:hypothetical protein